MKVTIHNPKSNYNQNHGLLQNYNLTKLFLILHSNIYVFDWELKKKYNLLPGNIQKYTIILEQMGYLSYNLLSELDLNIMETILKTSPDADKIYRENPKVYTITSTGRREGREIVTKILQDTKTHESWHLLVKDLMERSRSRRIVLAKIQQEEKTQVFRKLDIPGFPITLKIPSKIVRQSLQQLPKKEGSTALKGQNSTSLSVINNIQNRKVLEITQHDERIISEQNTGINEKEYKTVQAEAKKQISQRVKDLYSQTAHYKNKEHLLEYRPYEETVGKYFLGNPEPIEEGLQFLNSLERKDD